MLYPARSTVVLLLSVFFACSVIGEDWPCWRGPRGDGSSTERDLPAEWDVASGKNILWRMPMDGIGHGSPIVIGNKLFLATCEEAEQSRCLVCVDTDSGKILWRRVVFTAPLEVKHKLNSFASSTPASDGSHVYVAFLEVDGSEAPAKNVGKPRSMTPGEIVIAAYDLEGDQAWIQRPGIFASVHGFCSNPVLHGDSIILNGDHDGDSYLVALDRSDGQVLWKVPRLNKTRSYATPIVRNISGIDQLVLPGSKAVTSFNPNDGSQIWRIDGPTEQFVASPVYNGEFFFVSAGFPTHHVVAIRPDGRNDVTDTHVVWHQTSVRSYVPSPLLVGEFLLVADDRGTANCYNVKTGERHWNVRLGRKFSASPVTANGLAYFLAENGVMHIIKPAAEFNQITECSLGEGAYASPAIAGGRFYFRGERHLVAVGKK